MPTIIRSNAALAILQKVAPHMPEEWRAAEPWHEHNAKLCGPDGMFVFARIGTYGTEAGRLLVSGGTPPGTEYSEGDYHGVDQGEITVAATRDPAAIAREIERRLLPKAIAAWQEIAERIERRTARQIEAEALANDLANIMGGSANQLRREWSVRLPTSLSKYYGSLTVEHGGAAVKLDLSGVPADRAREVAALIATWAEKA